MRWSELLTLFPCGYLRLLCDVRRGYGIVQRFTKEP
jgi:hypothetical protein